MKNIVLPAFVIASAATASSAGVVAFSGTYTFPGSQSTGVQQPQAYNGSAITGLTPGSVAVSTSVTSTNSNSNYRASGWGTGATNGSDVFTGSIDLDKYFSFTLTANSGYTFDMSSITFGIGRSGTGPRQWQWRSSVDNFASALSSIAPVAGITVSNGVMTTLDSTSTTWFGNVLSFSGPSFQGLSSVTFRLYGYNAEGTAGTGGFQGALSFAGSTTLVPAPGALALLGVAGLAAGARRRR